MVAVVVMFGVEKMSLKWNGELDERPLPVELYQLYSGLHITRMRGRRYCLVLVGWEEAVVAGEEMALSHFVLWRDGSP